MLLAIQSVAGSSSVGWSPCYMAPTPLFYPQAKVPSTQNSYLTMKLWQDLLKVENCNLRRWHGKKKCKTLVVQKLSLLSKRELSQLWWVNLFHPSHLLVRATRIYFQNLKCSRTCKTFILLSFNIVHFTVPPCFDQGKYLGLCCSLLFFNIYLRCFKISSEGA